ncbi:MAG TPA: alpha/beta hydrolase [Verrucomicrobiae bacterium]|nr:alpha/beta hydrolase [Verrucomicrobiae bacterium]
MQITLLLGIGFVALVLWLRWSEPRMLYYPVREIEPTPDKLGRKYEDVTLTTSDGIPINGWFLPAPQPPSANHEPSVGGHRSPITVLFFHGNAGNISHRFEKLEVFGALGVDAFIIDYRGYGRSEGKPSEDGTYRDARAAYEYLTKTRSCQPLTVVVYGESLGSAVAADLATKVDIGGLVLEEAFTSVPDVGQKMFPYLPVRWLVRTQYDTLAKMPRIHAPLLIFHSRDDEFFDLRHAQRLLAAANEPKQLIELRGGHNDAFVTSAETYRAGLKEFFARLSRPSS